MRRPTILATALLAILVVGFQNCGKLGFSLASNGKSNALLSLSEAGETATLNVTGEVPVALGHLTSLTVLVKNAVVPDVAYACVAADDPAASIGEGTVPLTDGVGVLSIRVDRGLSCTFTFTSGAKTVTNTFEVPVELPTNL